MDILRVKRSRSGLRPGEAVDLEDAYLEVTAGTERRVVEGRAAISLAESNVLVHPNSLAISVIH